MKKIIENKGLIMFYVVIVISTLILINDVEKESLNEENTYQMVMLDK